MLCGPVAKQESQYGQTGSPGARLAAQQGRHKGPAAVESNISCRISRTAQYAPNCMNLQERKQNQVSMKPCQLHLSTTSQKRRPSISCI